MDDIVRNPNNPDHYMTIRPLGRRVQVYLGAQLVAQSDTAVQVFEVGRSAYDPVTYIDRAAFRVPFDAVDKTSHCPLKGDASYIAVYGVEVAWTYAQPFNFAQQLAGRYAFWPNKVRMVEG